MAYIRLPVPKKPSIRVEKDFSRRHGNVLVAGVDEAGRGPLAGPVVAAAVMLPFDALRPVGLRDSKQLSLKERNRLFKQIKTRAITYGVGVATAQEIDLLNVLEATRLAVSRALEQLDPWPVVLVTDALELPKDPRPVLSLAKGDSICASISAASILAKVTRDRMMEDYSREFPEYNWCSNKGYPTQDHYDAIEKHGPCTLHRLSFNGVCFFTADPRKSPSFLALRSRLEKVTTETEREQVRQDLEQLRGQLPPPDYHQLDRLLVQPSQGDF